MAVHDMDILERLRRIVTKGHEPTDADALAAIAEIARLQLANKQSMEMADMRSAENCKLRAALKAARIHVYATAEADHMMDGFGPRKVRPSDELLAHIDDVLGGHVEQKERE